MTLWQIVYKGDIKLNTYVEMLKENGMLVAVEPTDLIDYDKFYALVQQWSSVITREESDILLNAALGEPA